MSNYDDLHLYLVTEGEVKFGWPDAEWDGERSILVAATSEEAALEVAEAYDKGLVQAGNLAWAGRTIGAVAMRDPDTGRYL
jgi:hypothetical protein